jgi:hypothetical protein
MTTTQLPETLIGIAGAEPPLNLRVTDVAPDTDPTPATLRVRVTGASRIGDLVAPGDRDTRTSADADRGASIVSVRPDRANDALDVVLRLGVDKTHDGWNHYTQPLRPGDQFSFVTDKYAFAGAIEDVVPDGR